MLKMKFWTDEFNDRRNKMRAGILRRFGRDEDGSIIILMLVLFVVMLVIGGMAVDFMRFESRRALLQSVSDRAVLAAAELDQQLTREEVVIDYFKKAGFDGSIVGSPEVTGSKNFRTVSVESAIDVDTFYLRLIGIDELSAPAFSTATEGSGDIEISLVLDISGSMYSIVPDTGGKRRIDLLKEAAESFVARLLKESPDGNRPFGNRVSISLVPYSSQVNVGSHIYDQLKTSSVSTLNPANCVEMPTSAFPAPNTTEGEPAYADGVVPTAFDGTVTYEQSQQYQLNAWGKGAFERWDSSTSSMVAVPTTDPFYNAEGARLDRPDYGSTYQLGDDGRNETKRLLDQPYCPNGALEEIIPVTHSYTDLSDAIDAFEPRGGTAIYMGLKWGVTLLDPSFESYIDDHPSTPSVFRDERPTSFEAPEDDPDAPVATKYLILMTDGENDGGRRIKSEYYNSDEEVSLWTNYNYPYLAYAANAAATDRWFTANYGTSYTTWFKNNYGWVQNSFDNEYGSSLDFIRSGGFLENSGYSDSQADTLMQNMCAAARHQNIIVHTIAFNAPANGKTQMRNCASKPEAEFYHETNGSNGALTAIFNKIAAQIVTLRLSL